MNAKKGVLFTVIVSLIVLSAATLNFNNLTAQNNNIATGDLVIEESEVLEKLKSSDNTINDHITTAESAAQWLRTEWTDNNFLRSGEIRLGQDGISGVGDFFVELYQVTGDTTYRDWAIDIANWLIYQHGVLGYPAGKWPNKVSASSVSNYSSYEQGVAGIGSFFINLYNATGNNTHKYQASLIHERLSSIKATTATGLAWEEQDSLSLTDGLGLVSVNNIYNGTEITSLSNLNSYDGSYYQVNANANFDTNVTYGLNMTQLIPFEDLLLVNEFMSKLTVKITVRSSIGLTSGDVYLKNHINGSWVQMNGGSIGVAEQEFSKVINSDFINWTWPLLIVNVTTTAGAPNSIFIDALNYTIDYNNGYNSTSYSTGAAGIGDFYLDMLENDLGNATLISNATGAGNFIIEEAILHGENASWFEKGSYYTTIDKGAAGIGRFLLRLNDATGVGSYDEYARRAADWLINNNITVASLIIQNKSLLWAEDNETVVTPGNVNNYVFPGMDYCAGIGQFLLELGQDEGGMNRYITNATYAANWLMNTQYMVETEDLFDYEVYCKWKYFGVANYGYKRATTGALEFFNNMFMELEYTNYSSYLSRGMEWVIKTVNITTDEWNGDNSTYDIGVGLAGVGLGLIRIDVKKGYITADTTPSQLEFNVLPRVQFSIGAYGSSINENHTFIKYAYGDNYLTGTWDIDHLNHSSGDDYFFDFEYINYNNTWHYAIFLEDDNHTLSFDNNGSEYQMYIADTVAPVTRLVPLYGAGIGAGDSGILEVRVKKNDTLGSPFDYFNVRYLSKDFDVHDIDTNYWDPIEGEYVFEVQIDIPADQTYGTAIPITVDTYDRAMNFETDIEILTVSDNFDPTLSEAPLTPSSRWVPQFVEVEIEAKVEDIGAGLDPNTGVFVKYTTDDGATWQTALLSKSGSKYIGKIPGQFMLVKVYYVYGAKDKSGNEVYWDIFHSESGKTYSSPQEIVTQYGLDVMYSYSITVNWTMLLVLVGVIALIIVSGYLIYSKRGGYLERMRRKSKATATGLAIKEKITNFYYKLYDKMNKIGERMSKGLSGSGGKIQLWFSDHFGDKPKKFFTVVGRALWAIPKGIYNGIANLFKGLGRVITNSKAWHIIFFMGLGFTMLITTVLQFLMAAGYPLRAVFFANMGFMMLIAGIVAFLLRFIYKLSYK